MLATILMSVSCSDYLNKTPDEDMTLDMVFTNQEWTDQFLAHIYSWCPNEANFADDGGAWRNPFVGGCDEMEIAFGGAFSHDINSGAWNTSNINRVPIWNETYMAVRKVNQFLENLDKVPNASEELKIRWRGEGCFLRAYHHFLSFRAYGPIVLLDRSLAMSDDLLSFGRKPIDECVAFIVKDCDAAIAKLQPAYWDNTNLYGRATSVAAMALKSRVLLYAASPLYNGNAAYVAFKDSLGTNFISQVYNGEKWKKAADAALECITASEANGYALHTSNPDKVVNYQEIFYMNFNEEQLFVKPLNMYDHLLWCDDPISLGGYSIINPTQEIVDSYEMVDGSAPITGYNEDGTPIINPASGYTETGYVATADAAKRWPTGVNNMFVNREPRFYASINYPGQLWKTNLNGTPHELAFWYNGIDGKRFAGSDYCKTGYLMRKIVNPRSTRNYPSFYVNQSVWVYFRLGEQYLNYAEAINEYEQSPTKAYPYINALRNRSGLPNLPAGLTYQQMRDKIKHERRIELAFETHRFFDVRRWKDAENSENKPIHSLNIMAGTKKQDDAFYRRIVVEQRIFESPKHYLFPIHKDEINKNRLNLMQNPGW